MKINITRLAITGTVVIIAISLPIQRPDVAIKALTILCFLIYNVLSIKIQQQREEIEKIGKVIRGQNRTLHNLVEVTKMLMENKPVPSFPGDKLD